MRLFTLFLIRPCPSTQSLPYFACFFFNKQSIFRKHFFFIFDGIELVFNNNKIISARRVSFCNNSITWRNLFLQKIIRWRARLLYNPLKFQIVPITNLREVYYFIFTSKLGIFFVRFAISNSKNCVYFYLYILSNVVCFLKALLCV